MKLTLALIHKLKRLAHGDALPASLLKGAWVEELVNEHILEVEAHRTKRNYRVKNAKAFLLALPKYNEGLVDLDTAERLLQEEQSSRAEQAYIGGNSKIINQRTCPGFLVNSYTPIECSIHGSPFIINPPEGSLIFVADWQSFSIPADTLVIVIENMENFRRIRQQSALFESQLIEREHNILFVSRYPQSKDLRQWLCSIPNRCVHFGDFDLAGIHIFLSEFQKYLGDRSSFLIPKDIEELLEVGSRFRYDFQYKQFRYLQSQNDEKLQSLIDLIHKYRRGYDQEGFIEFNS